MRVIHINTNDYSGGAAIAASRLSCALEQSGVDSSMFSLYSQIGNGTTVGPCKQALSYPIRLIDRWLLPKTNPSMGLFSSARFGYDICKHESIEHADVIYIHWINHCFLSLNNIDKLCKTGKQIIIYMHDMWHATGGCHHSFDCMRYSENCDNCPFFVTKNDLAAKQLRRKIDLFTKYPNAKIIAPSSWLTECVRNSTVFKKHNIYTIPNPIDTTLFKPADKQAARRALSLPLNKKIICFGADAGTHNPYKGWMFLQKALHQLQTTDIEILIFGSEHNPEIAAQIPYPTHFTGKITKTQQLLDTYNSADMFVSPSLADNFPNVIVESMACGVPVVGFDVGGIPDLIEHKTTGYLAKYKDSKDLALGIDFMLTASDYNSISTACVTKITSLCSYEVVASKHKQLLK